MNGSVRKQGGDRDDVIRRDAVFQTMRTASVLRDIAADRARGLTRRVRRVVQTIWRDRSGQRAVHHSRLDDRKAVVGIDRENLPKPVQPDEHDPVSERAARESGSGTAWNEGQVQL